MRGEDEIQMAHDMLWAQVMEEVPFVFDESARLPMRAALDVLCWTLQHDHADGFDRTLKDLTEGLAELGYRLQRFPDSFTDRLLVLVNLKADVSNN